MKANRFLNKNEAGYTALVPMVLAIVIVFALIYIGAYVNGTLTEELEDSFGAAAQRTINENRTLSTQGNITENFDTGLDILQVTIIITILAAAIGAIFLFTRFRG